MRTTHSMSCSGRGPGGDPPTSKELWRQDCCACAVRASSLQTLVGSVGERLPPTQPHHLFTSVPWFFRGRDRCGRAAKGFTPLCSNYPQLAPGHTLWWVLGVERRPTPLPNYTASSCGLYRVSEGRDDRTSPREVSVRFV